MLVKSVDLDEAAELRMSTSTLQRIINEYLDARNLHIVFKQTDHNACPNCKTLQYAVLQYHQEAKGLAKMDRMLQEWFPRPFEQSRQEELDSL